MINYKDEFYVRVFRCWLIITTLDNKRVGESKLEIEKCAFFDYLISNPSMLKKCLKRFDRNQKIISLPETLYPSNIEFGDYQDKKEFIKTAFFLERCGYIEINKTENSHTLSSTNLTIEVDQSLTNIWVNNILQLKPLIPKSITVLQKSILSENNNE